MRQAAAIILELTATVKSQRSRKRIRIARNFGCVGGKIFNRETAFFCTFNQPWATHGG